jgi:transposase
MYDYMDEIHEPKNLVDYQDRRLMVKQVSVNLCKHKAWAYICLDLDRKLIEDKAFYRSMDNTISRDEMGKAMSKHGKFILVSSEKFSIYELLPLYYTRQEIEQYFDTGKTDIDFTPARCHNEDTLRGHLFLCFLSSIAYISFNKQLAGSGYSAKSALEYLSVLRCDVYHKVVIPGLPNKQATAISKYLHVTIPEKLTLPFKWPQ